MLGTLIESRRTRLKFNAQGAVSLVVHAAIGLVVIRTTRPPVAAASPIKAVIIDTWAVPAMPVTSHPGGSLPTTSTAPVLPVFDAGSLPPIGNDIPVSTSPAIDLKGLVGAPNPGQVGVPGGADSTLGLVTTAEQVDEVARVIFQPRPRFPAALQAAGLDGRVVVQFVVDTTGHVEPGSVRIVESTHPGFEASAQEVARASVFAPGRIGSRAVRQYVRQGISYRIGQ